MATILFRWFRSRLGAPKSTPITVLEDAVTQAHRVFVVLAWSNSYTDDEHLSTNGDSHWGGDGSKVMVSDR